jgi:hypothetical protein
LSDEESLTPVGFIRAAFIPSSFAGSGIYLKVIVVFPLYLLKSIFIILLIMIGMKYYSLGRKIQ